MATLQEIINSPTATMAAQLFKTPITFDGNSADGKKIVRAAQGFLNAAGSPKLTVDGVLGPNTKAALKVAFPTFESSTWLTILTTINGLAGKDLKYPIKSSPLAATRDVLNKSTGGFMDKFDEILGFNASQFLLPAAIILGAWYWRSKSKATKTATA